VRECGIKKKFFFAQTRFWPKPRNRWKFLPSQTSNRFFFVQKMSTNWRVHYIII